jgi:hypothetical protein
MHAVPPAAEPLVLSVDYPWLPPIRFGVKPYLELCRSVDQALAELETRYPAHRQLLTLESRNKRLKHRPK